ncbi:MAG: hypothetical protein WD794_02230 [Mycobacteriales bacterium]
MIIAVFCGALLGLGLVLLPGGAGQGVSQCVDGTDGGYCRDYLDRSWPDPASLTIAAVVGAGAGAALAWPLLSKRREDEASGREPFRTGGNHR